MKHRSLFISASAVLSAIVALAACEKTPPEPAPGASSARPAETSAAPTAAPSSAATPSPSVIGTITPAELGPLQDPKEVKSVPAPADVAAVPSDAKKTASGLALKVLTPGTGKERPGPDDKVKVHYTGWTTDGKMFDSSVTRGEPTSFRVSGVIKGWTEGLQLMTAGEKARLWIPAKLAYGDTPAQPGMPAGMLVFDVELLEIATAPKPPTVPPDVKAAPASAKKTESGLAYRVLQKGTGTRHPKPTDRVKVHYSGWTPDGKMFDSSVTRGEPTAFGLNGVIKGWTEGVQLMVEGEKTRFWIPGGLAYGDTPRPGAPGGPLVFDIELLSID
ncbi:MAG TPA: FKBP-type peptidyl-prolyl cis-trans isomerase [Polyangiaceae bacterium]|jgi:peptidylprolyl isomerase|nr:FKBP-type peptidyl-prolyl cis-trans isomerase [Polyangiaceae bacterium]